MFVSCIEIVKEAQKEGGERPETGERASFPLPLRFVRRRETSDRFSLWFSSRFAFSSATISCLWHGRTFNFNHRPGNYKSCSRSRTLSIKDFRSSRDDRPRSREEKRANRERKKERKKEKRREKEREEAERKRKRVDDTTDSSFPFLSLFFSSLARLSFFPVSRGKANDPGRHARIFLINFTETDRPSPPLLRLAASFGERYRRVVKGDRGICIRWWNWWVFDVSKFVIK